MLSTGRAEDKCSQSLYSESRQSFILLMMLLYSYVNGVTEVNFPSCAAPEPSSLFIFLQAQIVFEAHIIRFPNLLQFYHCVCFTKMGIHVQ